MRTDASEIFGRVIGHVLDKGGTSEGAVRGWETRRGMAPVEEGPKITINNADLLNEARIRYGIEGLPDTKLAKLAGIVGNSNITIGADKKLIYISAKSDQYEVYNRLHQLPDGKLAMEIFYLEVFSKGEGIGTQIFINQVKAAVDAGISKIGLQADGSKGTGRNGYYTWPRLGFDGKLSNADIPSRKLSEIGALFPEAENISDLMKTPEGRSWWKENGGPTVCLFDLSENSLGRRVLNEYSEEKARQSGKPSGDERTG